MDRQEFIDELDELLQKYVRENIETESTQDMMETVGIGSSVVYSQFCYSMASTLVQEAVRLKDEDLMDDLEKHSVDEITKNAYDELFSFVTDNFNNVSKSPVVLNHWASRHKVTLQ